MLEVAEDGALLAGGMTLIPLMKQGLAAPSDLVDLAGLAELRTIRQEAAGIRVGALATHDQIASDAAVRSVVPALAGLAAGVGDPQVRNRGTIGGAIATNDPAGDYPAALVALAATIETSRRTIAADDFFTGLFETALEPGEIVTAIAFAAPRRAAYVKFEQSASRYALVGVMVAESHLGVRVAATGAGAYVFRIAEMELQLERTFSPDALESAVLSPEGLNADVHASAEYRAHLVGVMARRAVAAAL